MRLLKPFERAGTWERGTTKGGMVEVSTERGCSLESGDFGGRVQGKQKREGRPNVLMSVENYLVRTMRYFIN